MHPSNDLDLNPIDERLNDCPPVLFKYRSFDVDGYGIALAAKGEAFFASPLTFNDPFECALIPKTQLAEMTPAQQRLALNEKTKKHFPGVSRAERRRRTQDAMVRLRKMQRQSPRIDDALVRIHRQKIGVMSLAHSSTSIPMWAYYGENHTGLCVGIRTSCIAHVQRQLSKQRELLMLYKAAYTDTVPIVGVDAPDEMDEDQRREAMLPFYTKSSCWRHEDELRLLYWGHPNTVLRFGSAAIAEVVVGARASREDIDKLIAALDQANSSANVYQATLSETMYEVELSDVLRT